MTYTERDLGCWFDGAYGFDYNANRVIELATEYGYEQKEPIHPEDDEALHWEVLEAEAYLNGNTQRPSDSYWGWIDGDFGLWLHCPECGEVMGLDEGCLYCEGE
jgi:hypothetical protein